MVENLFNVNRENLDAGESSNHLAILTIVEANTQGIVVMAI